MSKLALLPVLAAAIILMAPDCPNGSVTINYHQVGACNGGNTDSNDFYNAGPNQAYVVFAIEGIDNSKNPNNFAYNPSNIHSIQAPQNALDSNLQIYNALFGPFATAPVTVNAGTKIGFNPNGYGALIVTTTAQDGASEANKTSYFLGYKGSGSPGNPVVFLAKSNADQTSWENTPNCADIVLQLAN